MQQAHIVEGEAEQGIKRVEGLVLKELGMRAKANPDFIVLRYGLLTIEDARAISSIAATAAHAGDHKVIIIAAARAYHEAQNALLKIFEEPPEGAYLFLILPSLGSLLPTLRSRVQILRVEEGNIVMPEAAQTFLTANKEKRSALIKKLASGRDDEERRENRDEALSIVNGIEQAAVAKGVETNAALLSDISKLRGFLYDRSAPVRMILEHLSLVLPRNLL